MQESTGETIVSLLERLIGRKPPYVLCRSRIYETFIIKLYKVSVHFICLSISVHFIDLGHKL